MNETKKLTRTPVTIPLTWSDDPAVQQVSADEAIIQYLGDRVYLSVGQVQVPPSSASVASTEGIEVRPVARLVLTSAAFYKLVDLLNNVAASIPRPIAVNAESVGVEKHG